MKNRLVLIRLLLLAASVALMIPGAWGHSVTVVEYAQLPAGLAAWQRQSFGVYRVCGPLSKLLYGMPAYLYGVRVSYPSAYDSGAEDRPEWVLGGDLLRQHVTQYHALYRWTRLVAVLVTVLGGCLVCWWSTKLFGAWPGLLSLSVWCLMPPVLAHGSLVTSDMVSAVTLLLAACGFWAFLTRPGTASALLAGLALGLAEASKFTLLVIYPCWLALLVGRAVQLRLSERDPGAAGRTSATRLFTLGLMTAGVSVLVLDALYLFQGVGVCLADVLPGRSSLGRSLQALGDRPATAWLLRIPLPAPRELLRGVDLQLWENEQVRPAYLLGQTRVGGWWYWYPCAFLLKVPVPAIALFGLTFFRLGRPWGKGLGLTDEVRWGLLCLLLPAAQVAVLVAATSGTGTNAAFRYLLPSLGLLCVAVGVSLRTGSRRDVVAASLLCAWLALNALRACPDHLGWQNEIGQWASRDRPALLGDSLDWGQDLARLGGWVSRHSRDGSTLVCVYGLGSVQPYGLHPPDVLPVSSPLDGSAYVAVSANILFGYETAQCAEVEGVRCPLLGSLRRKMLRTKPCERVSRTILVYRARDLL